MKTTFTASTRTEYPTPANTPTVERPEGRAPARGLQPTSLPGQRRAGRWVCTALSLLVLLALTLQPARAATRIWTGAHATSGDWSRNANWDTAAPANGDTVVFPAGAARLANNNDIAGLQLAVIRFIGAGGGYTLGGNGVTLSDRIVADNTAGANTIDLARITLDAGARFAVQQAGVTLTIDSEVRLNGNDLTANPTGILVLRGVVTGNGNVLKNSDGILTLSGTAANTFTGGVFVNAGSVFMGKTTGLAVPHRLVIGDGLGGAQSDIALNTASDQVNEVTVNASGLWNVGNFTENITDLVLNEGGDVETGNSGNLRLAIGADVTVTPGTALVQDTSLITGKLELLLGTHTFTVSEGQVAPLDRVELQIDAVIRGLGGMTKDGAGDLLLTGNNSFASTVNVNGGELRLRHSSALGTTTFGTAVNNNADLLLLGDVFVGDEALTLNSTGRTGSLNASPALRALGSNTWGGDITLQQETRIGVATNGHLTLNSTISGSGGIVKEEPGTLRLAGNAAHNSYSGTTFVHAGTLELDKGTIGGVVAVPGLLVIGDGAGGEAADVVRHRKDNQVNRVTVNGSGFWNLGGFDEEVSELTLNNGGDVLTTSTGRLRLGIGADVTVSDAVGPIVSDCSISGNLDLLVGQHDCTIDSARALTIYATISGPGGIAKKGPDFLLLRAANSFEGLVTVDEGILQVNNPLALGSTVQGTRVSNDATLTLSTSSAPMDIVDEPLILDSTGGTGNNALLCGESGSWTGPITLLRQSGIEVVDGESFDLRGTIGGVGGLIKIGAGTLLLSGNGANSYAGSTVVHEGRLELDKAALNVAVPGALEIDGVVECLGLNEIGPLSAVKIGNFGQLIARQEEFGSLAGFGNVSVASSLNAGADDTSTIFSGVISGAGAFNKMGTGTLTFSGNNTYTGDTGIDAGTLLVNGQQPASSILIQPAGTLGGSGRVGNLSMFAGGATVAPGSSPGRLTAGNVSFAPDSVFGVELDGPVPGTQHDQLRALGTVDLGGARLQATLRFTPTLGQPIVIIDNDGTNALTGRFSGLQEGDTIRLDQVPFAISYRGGDGNDVTLTATNKSISVLTTRIEAGNGNGVIDPNECNHLFVALVNETGNPLAVSHVVLDAAMPGVAVTQQSSEYALFGALDIRTNRTPFQIRTTPDFICGQLIDFLLTVTVTGGGGGTFTIPFSVSSGGAGAPVPLDNGANLNLPDLATATSTITVANAAPYVGKVAVSLHITHPSAGDLILRLRSPSGTTVFLANNRGGTTDNYGGGCGEANRTTFDDAAPTKIAAGAAPFMGSFTPEEPLAAFLGENPNGDWQLLISDTVAGDTGELRCWSLLLSPPDCTDGGGACESCVPTLTGRFTADMPSTTTRLVRNGVPSGCGSPKACPAIITGPRLFDRVHLITNTGPETCVTVVLIDLCRASNLRLHAAAYLGSYNPADPCANYLGDTGAELATGSTSFSFAAPQDAVIALVVSSPATAPLCPLSYSVQLHGLPCPPPTLHMAKTANPDEVRLFWSTAYPGFDLQRASNPNGAGSDPFVNVAFTPFVVNDNYSVTNTTSGDDAYYRLRKP